MYIWKTTCLLFKFGIFLVNTVEPRYFELAGEIGSLKYTVQYLIVNEWRENPIEIVLSSQYNRESKVTKFKLAGLNCNLNY